MIVSKLDKNHDWTFGRSMANYARASEAIAQNVVTRLLSWKRDWFLDVEAEIDWEILLSERNTKDKIESEIARVVRTTNGVRNVISITASVNRSRRSAQFKVEYVDIYGERQLIENGY